MADTEDTFSSDTEPLNYKNTTAPKTSFEAPDGKVIEADTEYDPKTGENLTISKITKMAPELKPIVLMKPHDSETPVRVPLDKLHFAVSQGWKTYPQMQAENQSDVAKQTVKEGRLDLLGENTPSDEIQSLRAGAGRAMSFNAEPQIVGAVKGIGNKLSGGDYLPAYREGRDIEESANESLKNQNPKSYLGGEVAGSLSQFVAAPEAELGGLASKIPFGSFGRNVAGNAAASGLSGATEAANKGQDINNIASEGLKETGIGALGGATGYGAGELGSLALKGAEKTTGILARPETRTAFTSAMHGEDFTNPEVQKQVLDTAANYKGKLEGIIDNVRSAVGAQKQNHLNSIGSVDTKPLQDQFSKIYNNLESLKSKTGDLDELHVIGQAQLKLAGAEETLSKNPTAIGVDKAKQALQGEIFGPNGEFISRSGNKNIHDVTSVLENARKSTQKYIEDLLPNQLKGTNKAYQDILNATNPQDAYDKVIPDLNQIESMTKGNKSLVTRKVLNNLEDFNGAIQTNPHVPNDVKSQLNEIVENYDDVIHRASVVNKINSASGYNPLKEENLTYGASKLGSYLNPENNEVVRSTQKIGQTINGVLKDYYDRQSPEIQNLIKNSPEFAQRLIKSIPRASGVLANEGMR